MDEVWTQLRVRRTTRVRLGKELEVARKLADVGRGPWAESGKPGGGDPSMDWLLNMLLDRFQQHRKRSKRAHAKRQHGDTDKEVVGQLSELLELNPAGVAEADRIIAKRRDANPRLCPVCNATLHRLQSLHDPADEILRCCNCTYYRPAD